MNKSSLPTWLSGLCALLLAAVLALQLKESARLKVLERQQADFGSVLSGLQGRLSDQAETLKRQQVAFLDQFRQAVDRYQAQSASSLAGLQSGLAEQAAVVQRQQSNLMTEIRQQTAVLHRALGKVIPVELPESLTKKLGALEARIADEKSWPKDTFKVEALRADLRGVLTNMPAWAEDDSQLLPRLNKVRWGVAGLALVARSDAVPDNELADFLDYVDTALEAKPDGASELVANKLASVQGKIKAQFDSFRRNTAVADAERLIKEGGMDADFSEVEGRLSEWSAVPEFKDRIGKLRHDLNARELSDDTDQFIASVNKSLLRVRSEPSALVRQISFGRLLDSVVSQREVLVENQDMPETSNKKLADISVQIEKAIEAEGEIQAADQEKKSRAYQQWALGQIQNFNHDFQQTASTIPRKSDFQQIERDMVHYLVPISTGLLDSAVARLYNDAFEKGWKKIEGEKDTDGEYLQSKVAQQEAVVEKHKP